MTKLLSYCQVKQKIRAIREGWPGLNCRAAAERVCQPRVCRANAGSAVIGLSHTQIVRAGPLPRPLQFHPVQLRKPSTTVYGL